MLGYVPGDFPEADLASQETLAIPLYPELGIDRLNLVVTALNKAFKEIL
jgi:dTDP-4-amino-4,6-dideoxygalactose transaminase